MSQPVLQRRTVALQRDRVLWRQLSDQVLVLDMWRSRYLRLNHSGSLLWHLLAEPRQPCELVEVLLDTYDVSREEAADDVAAFLAELRGRGLLRDPA